MSRVSALVLTAALAATPLVAAPAASSSAAVTGASRTTKVVAYKSCAQLNRVYPHGVGKPGAVDKNKSKKKAKPVRSFTKNAKVYAAQPKSLDRDHDGIACEKH